MREKKNIEEKEVMGIPIYGSKIVKLGKDRVALLFNHTDKRLDLGDHQEDFKETYECDHLIVVQNDRSCSIYTRENTKAYIPKNNDPLEVVEADAVDFLAVILEKEKEDVERYKEIDTLNETIEKLQEIDGCHICGGTGEEIKGYLLDGRHELIGSCEECHGTGVAPDLEKCIWTLRGRIRDIKRGKGLV